MACSLPASSVSEISRAIILEWVAIYSSTGSSRPRDWTQVSCVSCIACGFFTHWAIRKAPPFVAIDAWDHFPQTSHPHISTLASILRNSTCNTSYHIYFIKKKFFFFACSILVPWPGIKPVLSAVGLTPIPPGKSPITFRTKPCSSLVWPCANWAYLSPASRSPLSSLCISLEPPWFSCTQTLVLRHSRFFPTSWYFALPSAQNRILAQNSAWPTSLSLSNQCPFRELLWWSFLRWCPLPPHQLLPPHLALLHSTSQMTFYYMLFISFVSLACMGSLWSQSCLLLHSSTRMQWALSKYFWMNGWMSEWPTIDPTHSHKIIKAECFALCLLIFISNRYVHISLPLHFLALPFIGCVTLGQLFNLCASVFFP